MSIVMVLCAWAAFSLPVAWLVGECIALGMGEA